MGSGAPDWRSTISFSDRLQSVIRIQIGQEHKHQSPLADAQARAKSIESEIFKTATSRVLYETLISEHIQQLESIPVVGDALQQADLSDDVDQIVSGGITIGDYINAQHHKDGQTANIYKAKSLKYCPSKRDVWKKGIVALKVTHPSTMTPPHDSRREARLLAASASEHVIPLFNTFTSAGGQFVLVFPFLPLDLGEALERDALTDIQRKTVLKDVLSALAYIHDLGMIHRDIKPSNILMRQSSGQAWLADFGIAWSESDHASEAADKKILDVGTTCYRPPELMFGNERYNSSLDMWAFGCVAAQVLSLGPRTLFDSGELGSDLALIKSIFETLGTPDLEAWPEAAGFPDWGKMAFKEYPGRSWDDILPRASLSALDFVSQLVRYESGSRLTPAMALQHPLLV